MMQPYDVALTSCGRFDLLARTLDSLLPRLEGPVRQILICEDSGDPAVRDAVAPYGDDIAVLINSPKLGHIRSIDRLYSHVRADWIFHCEDDWQFFRAGFIAESFAFLGASETVSMVALRALSDFKPGRFGPDGLAVDISAYPCAGLQFNPGLRRLGDYRKIGPYAGWVGGSQRRRYPGHTPLRACGLPCFPNPQSGT